MISRKLKSQDNDNGEIFQTPTAQIFDDVDNERGEKLEPADERYDALAKQMADLQSRLVETERANMALITTQGNASQVQTFVPEDPNKIPLPDPAIDPDGFSNAQLRRTEVVQNNFRRQNEFNSKQQQNLNDKVDSLWEQFNNDYPEMAGDKDRIDFIATKVSKAAIARGIDVQRYMFVTQDKYLKDVASEYVKVFGEPETDDDNENNTQDRRRNASRNNAPRRSRARNEEDEYDSGRTGGVFGGQESGGRPSRQRQRDDDENSGGSMIDDIQALQRKTGFF